MAKDITRTPHPRNSGQTRARILNAACEIFSRSSFGDAGIREIAAAADVNVALVMKYFGSKERLLEAALENLLHAERLWVAGGANFGRDLAQRLLDARGGPNPLPMMVLASTDPIGQRVAMAMIEKHVLAPFAERLGPPNGFARAERVLAVCVGFVTWRVLLPLPNLAGPLDGAARTWLENALQAAYDS